MSKGKKAADDAAAPHLLAEVSYWVAQGLRSAKAEAA